MTVKSLMGGALATVASVFLVSGAVFAQASTSVHLAMGNPSSASTSISAYNNYLMVKPQYAESYHRDRGGPNWVSWHLDTSWLGSAARQDDFRADTSLPSGWYRVTNTDYTGSGYDRGHNCPSADRTSSVTNNSATFLMTNIVPQTGDNNQGPWARLEDYVRSLISGSNSGYEAYVIMANRGNSGTIANGKVTIPAYNYKIIIILPKGTGDDSQRVTTANCRVIAVKIPNIAGIRNNDWRSYRVSVDSIESDTGYNFLSQIPDGVENVIEARVDNL